MKVPALQFTGRQKSCERLALPTHQCPSNRSTGRGIPNLASMVFGCLPGLHSQSHHRLPCGYVLRKDSLSVDLFRATADPSRAGFCVGRREKILSSEANKKTHAFTCSITISCGRHTEHGESDKMNRGMAGHRLIPMRRPFIPNLATFIT